MKLDIWFDIDCPNCYLSLKQFFRLYHYMGYRYKEDTITFYPLRLNPTIETDENKTYLSAVKTHAYLKQRKQEKFLKNMLILGDDEGIHFNFEKLFPVNTTRAIQLVLYTQKYENDKLEDVLFALYEAYFEKYQNIDNLNIIKQIANEHLLDTKKITALFEQNTFLKTIEKDSVRANRLGITGLPLFIFNDDKALLGYYSDEKVKSLIVEAHL